MEKRQKSYRLESDLLEILDRVKKDNSFTSETEALTYIIKEYDRQANATLTDKDKSDIADLVVRSLTDKLKNQTDRIRLASTFSERYSYMILDAINTLLYESDNLFLMPANGETKHEVIRKSEENYKAMIERNKQIRDNEIKKGRI